MKASLVALVLSVALLWGFKVFRDAHYFDNYSPEAPLNVAVVAQSQVDAAEPGQTYLFTEFRFDGYKGETVPAVIARPSVSKEKMPAVVFLHGIGQNKSFLKEIAGPFIQAGFAIATFDQYMQGARKLPGNTTTLSRLEAFRLRPAKTINEARRMIDYLDTLPEIDPQRIYLVGASYGAVTGSTLMAKEKRIRGGVMVYGGGDFGKLLDSYANHLAVAGLLGLIDTKNVNPEKPPLPNLTPSQERKVGFVLAGITPLVRYFLGVADPIHYVDQISPRPVYFQNGTHDVLVPAPAGRALQEAARAPKTVTWYESDHVGIEHEQTTRVLADGLNWLVEQDKQYRTPASNPGRD